MKTAFCLLAILATSYSFAATTVSIVGEDFYINGEPTYKGRAWKGHRIEGLLMNSRMVQGIFDDANPETVSRWAYPDTGKWDADRNTTEFIAAMPEWKKHGMLSFTINFQGGSPEGYSRNQPWDNNAFNDDGSIKPAYAARMKRVLDAADRLGIVPIVGYFYFGQSPRLKNDETAIKATEAATRFLFEGGWKNILVEINNETNPTYQPPILRPERVHVLIEKVKNMRRADGSRFLVGTSYGGGAIPTTNVVAVSDFILIHGNGVKDPARIGEMARKTRALPHYKPMPIVFNEDDHFDFDKPMNNFIAAVSERASWGYFDYRMRGETFNDGYQSVPVNWGLSSDRKRGFFKLCAAITGAAEN
jgi:hypothetical protein